MDNTIAVSEIKRRGMAAIEEGLRQGPVHIVKRNRPAAVILTEEDYGRLSRGQQPAAIGMTAMQWLLSQPVAGKRSKSRIDAELKRERSW